MTIDPLKTVSLFSGDILNAENTWSKWFSEDHDLADTIGLLTLPLVLIGIASNILFALFGPAAHLAPAGEEQSLALMLVRAVIGSVVAIVVATFVWSFLAGMFGGKSSAPKALAAVSFAGVPGALLGLVGSVLGTLGSLLALAGLIMTLVWLYRVIPLALSIPSEKKVVNFIVGLIAVIALNALVGLLLY
jgi:hypothetical protein